MHLNECLEKGPNLVPRLFADVIGSDWFIFLLVPRFFHARARNNKQNGGQRCLVRLLALGIFIAAATCTPFLLSE